MKETGASIIIQLLERQGVSMISGIPGGANLPLYHRLSESTIQHILCRHEQGGGFIAGGYSRVSGKTGVTFATSGPGATNLVTALADAMMDSIPMVAITGQVSSPLIGTDAFQEVDTSGITLPITRHNFLVRSGTELLEVIPLAFRIAASHRKGPVLIDVPKDVQTELVEFESWPEPGAAEAPPTCDEQQITEFVRLLNKSSRPLVIAGGGINDPRGARALFDFLEKSGIPVITTFRGMGVIPVGHPSYAGMAGMHGEKSANLLLEEADLIIAAGARLDDRLTGHAGHFGKRAHLIHIDTDRAELGKIIVPDLAIQGDAVHLFKTLAKQEFPEKDPFASWRNRIHELRLHSLAIESTGEEVVEEWIHKIAKRVGPEAIIATDVGQHQMWVARHYPFSLPGSLLSSGGLGTMGFGLPSAIGAAIAEAHRPVVLFSGDGSILMNIQELATLADLNLDVTIVVFDNGGLGMVAQQQRLFYSGRESQSSFIKKANYAQIASGFGIQSLHEANDRSAMEDYFGRQERIKGPLLLHIPVPASAMVYPTVPPGSPNHKMILGHKGQWEPVHHR